jgi:hypothetical protein
VTGVVGESLPQPQAPRLNATIILATNTRMLITLFCCCSNPR